MTVTHRCPRTRIIIDPETGKEITVRNDIMITNKPTRPYIGTVQIKREGNKTTFDDSDLHENKDNIFPAGMEVITMLCDDNYPFIPVMFNHVGIGHWYKVWIKRSDLDDV